jgi:hypothetical protein
MSVLKDTANVRVRNQFCTENIVVLVLCGGRASVYVVVLRD